MTVWVVGRHIGMGEGGGVWDILGVFTSKDLARKACTERGDFMGPLEIDKRIPDERMKWPGIEFPNLPNGEALT